MDAIQRAKHLIIQEFQPKIDALEQEREGLERERDERLRAVELAYQYLISSAERPKRANRKRGGGSVGLSEYGAIHEGIAKQNGELFSMRTIADYIEKTYPQIYMKLRRANISTLLWRETKAGRLRQVRKARGTNPAKYRHCRKEG